MTVDVMQIDAILADDVQVENGKMFVMGGGWNNLRTVVVPTRHARMGIGVVIYVPYTETNQPHTLEIRLEDEDGQLVVMNEGGEPPEGQDPLMSIKSQFTLGRPPDLPPGASQVIAMAIVLNNVVLAKVGAYSFVIEIDGTEMKRLPFRLIFVGQTVTQSP